MATDFQSLVAAIRANPADDLLRLVAADYLDEHDQPERAEFIRVQVEIARPFAASCAACGRLLVDDRVADGCPCNSPRGVNHGRVPAYVCTCPECDPNQTGSVRERPAAVESLRERERKLTPEQTLPCPACVAGCTVTEADATCRQCDGRGRFIVTYRRGFVESVRGPLSAFWVERECKRCRGRRGWHDALTGDGRCLDCFGTGRIAGPVPAFAELVVREPVVTVEVADRTPHPGDAGQWGPDHGLPYTWDAGWHGERWSLPPAVYAALPAHPAPPGINQSSMKGMVAWYPTEQAARAALSDALLSLVATVPV